MPAALPVLGLAGRNDAFRIGTESKPSRRLALSSFCALALPAAPPVLLFHAHMCFGAGRANCADQVTVHGRHRHCSLARKDQRPSTCSARALSAALRLCLHDGDRWRPTIQTSGCSSRDASGTEQLCNTLGGAARASAGDGMARYLLRQRFLWLYDPCLHNHRGAGVIFGSSVKEAIPHNRYGPELKGKRKAQLAKKAPLGVKDVE